MKKSMLMSGLMLGVLLSVSPLAGAAVYSGTAQRAEGGLEGSPQWGAFRMTAAYDAAMRSAGGLDAIKSALNKAYQEWLPTTAGGAGAMVAAIRAHDPVATAGAVVGDGGTLAALGEHRKAELIGAMRAHDPVATAGAVVGDGGTLAALGEHRKAELIGAMRAHDPVATAGAVVGDGGTLAALGEHRKAELIGAMRAHDPVATAGAVVGDGGTLAALGEHRKAELIGAMRAHDPVATAGAVVGDGGTLAALGEHRKAELIGAMRAHDPVATAGAVVGDGGTLAALGEHRKAELIGAMRAHDPVATAGVVVGDAALRRELFSDAGRVEALIQEGSGAIIGHPVSLNAMRTAIIGHADSHAATAWAIRDNEAMRNAVIADLQANGFVLRQASFRRLIRGANPTANGGRGNGLWNDIRANDHGAAKEKILGVGGIAPVAAAMPI